jgi:Putative auto-transporter adhesin, head GIN domain
LLLLTRNKVRIAPWGIAVLALPQSLLAAERNFSVTDFDKISVEGAYNVSVETGKSGKARATGSVTALERVGVEVRSRTLIIKPLRNLWGSAAEGNPGPVSIKVTTHDLASVEQSGSSALIINKMRGARILLSNSGSGTLTVGAVDTDQLDLDNEGSGSMTLSGRVLLATAQVSGSGSLDASALKVSDLTLTAQSSGRVHAFASRSAKVTSTGSGAVEIGGKPACTVNMLGTGTVSCGGKAR